MGIGTAVARGPARSRSFLIHAPCCVLVLSEEKVSCWRQSAVVVQMPARAALGKESRHWRSRDYVTDEPARCVTCPGCTCEDSRS